MMAKGALQMANSMFINMLEPDPFRALQLAEAGIASFLSVGDRRQEGLCRIACGEALYALGERERGAREMRSALQLGQKLHEPLVELLAVISLALNTALGGDAAAGAEAERLVAPVIEAGAIERNVILPGAEPWRHSWTGEDYSPGTHSIPAPMDRPPVFYRPDSEFAPLFAGLKGVLEA